MRRNHFRKQAEYSPMNQGCGGTIVGDKYIVTAAHCTDGATINDLFVRVGDTILGTEFEAEAFTYEVCEIIQHPGFSWSTFENDISILRSELKTGFWHQTTPIIPIIHDLSNRNHQNRLK